MKLRDFVSADTLPVRALLISAFNGPLEADLVEEIRAHKKVSLEWVSEEAGEITGMIQYSPVQINGAADIKGVGLAPIGVGPKFQKKGVGSLLITKSLAILKQRGVPFVVLLGEPDYYRRFGFGPAGRLGVKCEFDAPAAAFQILPLSDVKIPAGLCRYSSEFDKFRS